MSAIVIDGAIERRLSLGEIQTDLTQDHKIRGYAIVFNKLSLDLGGFRERILPEAVQRTLNEGLDVRALVDHDSSKIIGRTRAGTLVLKKDGRGLGVVIDPPNTSVGRDLMVSVDRGDVSGMSFSFRTLEDDWHMEDGVPIREVLDMTIREVSVVTFPAYPDTDVQVAKRSLSEFQAGRPQKHTLDYWRKWHRNQLAR